MGSIKRVPSNVYPMPPGSFVRNKKYVYVNTGNVYVPPSEKKEKGTRGYTGHTSVCIGVLEKPEDLSHRYFYANAFYLDSYVNEKDKSTDNADDVDKASDGGPADGRKCMLNNKGDKDPPKFSDGISIGLNIWIREAAKNSGLLENLAEVFGEEDSQLILDCCNYILSKESAVLQHYPAWASDHLIFSEEIRSDTFLGRFLKNNLSISKIKLFREKWAVRNIGDGRIFLCYDSTNVNSQAEGVFIVQKGYAKDDITLPQVNTDYVVRQSDGLPLTYLHSPGSVSDIAQAQEMIKFIKRIMKLCGKKVYITLVCDRGYISEKNVRHMDKSGIGYILMVRSNFGLYTNLANSEIKTVKSYKNELETDKRVLYGVTKPCCLYKDGPTCFAHVYWSIERYELHRSNVAKRIAKEREQLEQFIKSAANDCFISKELEWVPHYFKLELEPGEPRRKEVKKRGRGIGTKIVETPTFRVVGYSEDEAEINLEYEKAGIMIIVTREEMTAQECIDAYSKRDCVEKVFQALKSHLGMDKIGVTAEEAMHGKGLLWFVASILHSLMFINTSSLRITDKKHYTVSAMIDTLEGIKADKNLETGKRERRYKLTKKQREILKFWKIDEDYIDIILSNLEM